MIYTITCKKCDRRHYTEDPANGCRICGHDSIKVLEEMPSWTLEKVKKSLSKTIMIDEFAGTFDAQRYCDSIQNRRNFAIKNKLFSPVTLVSDRDYNNSN